MSGYVLDAGALIAYERGHRWVEGLLSRAESKGEVVTVPATVLAQVMRRPVVQARLRRLVRQAMTHVVPLDSADATNVGMLLALTKTSDIADAHVVICAQRSGQPIVTNDPEDIERLDPLLQLLVL